MARCIAHHGIIAQIDVMDEFGVSVADDFAEESATLHGHVVPIVPRVRLIEPAAIGVGDHAGDLVLAGLQAAQRERDIAARAVEFARTIAERLEHLVLIGGAAEFTHHLHDDRQAQETDVSMHRMPRKTSSREGGGSTSRGMDDVAYSTGDMEDDATDGNQKPRRFRGWGRNHMNTMHHSACVRWLDAAIEQAEQSWREGGIPIGSVLVDPAGDDGRGAIVARGHNMRVQWGDPTAHAEVVCIRYAGRRRDCAELHARVNPFALPDVRRHCDPLQDPTRDRRREPHIPRRGALAAPRGR